MKSAITCAIALCMVLGAIELAVAEVPKVTITTSFPGSNVLVQENDAGKVRIAPDLRGGQEWFYWYFEAIPDQAGRVTFILPEKMQGLAGPAIGMQGPAVSLDMGKTWAWLGEDHVKGSTFYYDFAQAGQKVRLAVTMPYLQSDLDAFLKANAGNSNLSRQVLTKSQKGREVELLQIGKPGPGVKAVLFTARHHACESMASFVLEGFLKSAIADTPTAIDFRKDYVLYAVPFVDKDGVEDGDQGKNRKPHDHNRDYGAGRIFPEVAAIEKLADEKQIRFSIDFHCPTLRYEDHQVIYCLGSKETPTHNIDNVKEFTRLVTAGLPPNSPHGPLVWMTKRKPQATGDDFTNHFAFRKGQIMAVTFEFPFAPPKRIMNATRGREIGDAMLNAWVKTKFTSALAQRTEAEPRFDWMPPEDPQGILRYVIRNAFPYR